MAAETKTMPDRVEPDGLEPVIFEPVVIPLDVTPLIERKAKIGIVCLDELGEPGLLVLTRSEHEKTRQFGPDFPGGHLIEGEKPRAGVERESTQELPGFDLRNVVKVARVHRSRNGIETYASIFLSNADPPASGIRFGLNDDGVPEHTAATVVRFDAFQGLEEMPKKYRRAVASDAGRAAIAGLIPTAQQIIIPPGIRETRW